MQTQCPLCLGVEVQDRNGFGWAQRNDCPLCAERGELAEDVAAIFRLSGLKGAADNIRSVRGRLMQACFVERDRSGGPYTPPCPKCGGVSKDDHRNNWRICSKKACRNRFRGSVVWDADRQSKYWREKHTLRLWREQGEDFCNGVELSFNTNRRGWP